MNNSKTSTVLAGVKELQGEIGAFEGRLLYVKSELEKATRERDLIKQEADNLRATLEQDAQNKLAEVRKARTALNEDKMEFDRQKAEFIQTLTAFKQDKNELERQKQAALDAKKNMEAITEKAGAFVRMVKSAAEGL